MLCRFSVRLACMLFLLFSHDLDAQKEDARVTDSGIVSAPVSRAEKLDAAWDRLERALNSGRSEARLDSVNALSLLGGMPRAETLIHNSMRDKDTDVQLASIIAAGEMAKAVGPENGFQGELRSLLNGSDPRVVYAAASTLWKLNDPSGEDILEAVAQGERSADYSFWKNSRQTASRDLHSPATLAKIGAMQGAVMLVPPIGIGMGAYNYLKGAAGISPQVTAITLIGHEHSSTVQQSLIAATTTKDLGARLAAIEALAYFQGDAVRDALEPLISDDKQNIRLSASAAYLRVVSGPHTVPPAPALPSPHRRAATRRAR